MKSRYLTYGASAASMLAIVLFVFVSAPRAQQAGAAKVAAAAAKPTPKMADGHPDFSGFWLGGVAGINYANDEGASEDGNLTRTADGSIIFLYGGPAAGVPAGQANAAAIPDNAPPYKPEYLAKAQVLVASEYGGNTSSPYDPMNDCKPNGVPRAGISGSHIIMNPAGIAVMYENNPGPVYRLIYTDGREHPKDLDTSYMGNSIGHWEGDTLVIDTVGLNDETWLGGGKFQLFHSDKEHVIERWSRQGDVMTRMVSVEDPVMFTKPWNIGPEKTTLANQGDYIQPEMCRTNDKAHLILQTPENQWKCNWCQVDADTVYGKGAAADNKANAPRRAGGGGGDE
jgi:hypothetical protein